MVEKVSVTVYSRENCHLCDEAIGIIEDVAGTVPSQVDIEVVDVDEDPDLRKEFGEKVPYILVNGQPAFKYRVERDKLRSKLMR
jgi:glutaredoxin